MIEDFVNDMAKWIAISIHENLEKGDETNETNDKRAEILL